MTRMFQANSKQRKAKKKRVAARQEFAYTKRIAGLQRGFIKAIDFYGVDIRISRELFAETLLVSTERYSGS